MAYDTKLADKIRAYLQTVPGIKVEEKKMFRGLVFMVNEKMCVCVSGENLMCRFDPELETQLSSKQGYQPMIMKGKAYKGYCYVRPEGIKAKKDLEFWINQCLGFNKKAKSSKKQKQT